MQAFLRERVELVRALSRAELPVTYADLTLITCAVLSACAARRWRGSRIDRKRFIELLVMHSAPEFHTSWVSVPALLNKGLIAEADTPYGPPGCDCRIFRDDEIDLSLDAAGRRYATVTRADLRTCCYAYLMYERLRCGYVHEYCPGEDINAVRASSDEARVSYITRYRAQSSPPFRKRISFHLPYLIELAEHHVSILPAKACALPSCWWIDGA